MPRKRVRTTSNRSYTADDLKQACQEVLINGRSTRNVAIQFKIPRITLKRYVDKCRVKSNDMDMVNFRPNNEHRMVFTKEEELLLKEYVQNASNIHYGLSAKQARILAYEFAVANNKGIKENWARECMAGKEWMLSFMNRHKLSLRTPEQTSLGRATSFNRTNVEQFFKNLRHLKDKKSLEASDIYNLDETGLTTVHKPPKILAPRGKRNVGQMTSAERGTLVTLVGIIGATGRYVPPFLIFPRVHFKDNMLHGTPPGSKGAATRSGWMKSDLFLPVLQHFAQHERLSKENPKLIILDNHESHLSIAALNFAKENGILILTLPPHCSHKLQPLDKAVFGPFKKFYGSACDRWMVNNPGKTISIYEVGGLAAEALLQVFTPKNICRGFRATGIEPFNDQIFSEEDFLSSYVTDRSNPLEEPGSSSQNQPPAIRPTINENVQSVKATNENLQLQSSDRIIHPSHPLATPEQIRPYPKAEPRKSTTRRRKGKSLILTETPVKEGLEEEARLRDIKKKIKPNKMKKEKVKRRVLEETSSSEENISFHESSDSPEDFEQYNETEYQDKISKDDFVICKVYGKNMSSLRHYVVKIDDVFDKGYDVTFMKRHNMTKFFSEGENGFAPLQDLVYKLPPSIKSSSARFANMITFNIDFSEFDFTVY